jgi:hypothetical protein
MTQAEKIKNSFLYMFGGESIAGFSKECEVSIVKTERSIKIPTFAITFKVPAPTSGMYWKSSSPRPKMLMSEEQWEASI